MARMTGKKLLGAIVKGLDEAGQIIVDAAARAKTRAEEITAPRRRKAKRAVAKVKKAARRSTAKARSTTRTAAKKKR